MRSFIVIFTIFAGAIWGPIGFTAKNINLGINVVPVIYACFLLVIGSLLLYGLISFLAKRLKISGETFQWRLSALVAMGIAGLFLFDVVHQAILKNAFNLSITITWLALYVLVLVFVGSVIKSQKSAIILLVFFLAMDLFSFATIVTASQRTGASQAAVETSISSADHNQVRPNVYYILVDAYARSDQLERLTGENNAAMLDWLDDQKFRVLAKAHSNYFVTHLSIPSMMSMRYISDGKGTLIRSVNELFDIFSGNSVVVKRFKDAGYKYVTIGNDLCAPIVDKCFTHSNIFSKEIWNLLFSTPSIVVLSNYFPETYKRVIDSRYTTVKEAAELVGQLKQKGMFLFGHFLEIHDTIYDAKCNVKESSVNAEMRRLREDDRMLKDRQAYIDTLKCVNKDLMQLIKTIERNDPMAVVVIAGDHGIAIPQLKSDPTKNSFIKSRSAIMSAWKLPVKCQNYIYDEMSAINHFRVIFNCLFNDDLQILPDKLFNTRSYTDFRSTDTVPEELYK